MPAGHKRPAASPSGARSDRGGKAPRARVQAKSVSRDAQGRGRSAVRRDLRSPTPKGASAKSKAADNRAPLPRRRHAERDEPVGLGFSGVAPGDYIFVSAGRSLETILRGRRASVLLMSDVGLVSRLWKLGRFRAVVASVH